MSRKAKDLLELYQRAEPQRRNAGLEPTTRMIVLRRSQMVVVCVGAGLVVVLAFLLGMAAGGGDEEATLGVTKSPWVIRVGSYADTDAGRRGAKTVASFLEKKKLGEVALQHLPAEDAFIVTVGAWINHPEGYKPARDLLKTVLEIPDLSTGGKAFPDAKFWRITR